MGCFHGYTHGRVAFLSPLGLAIWRAAGVIPILCTNRELQPVSILATAGIAALRSLITRSLGSGVIFILINGSLVAFLTACAWKLDINFSPQPKPLPRSASFLFALIRVCYHLKQLRASAIQIPKLTNNPHQVKALPPQSMGRKTYLWRSSRFEKIELNKAGRKNPLM